MSRKKLSSHNSDLFPKEFDVEICLKTIKIYQKIDENESCLKDASLILAKYLETMCHYKSDFLSGIKVLELSSGLGIVGLTAAILGAQVTLTDLPEALPLLWININENKSKIGSMGGYATAESVVWGDNSSEILKEEFDVIILADCIYHEEAIGPLIETLKYLCKSVMKKPIIYLTQELRDCETHRNLWSIFCEKLYDFFKLEKIPEDQLHVNYRSPDIVLLRLTKIF